MKVIGEYQAKYKKVSPKACMCDISFSVLRYSVNLLGWFQESLFSCKLDSQGNDNKI